MSGRRHEADLLHLQQLMDARIKGFEINRAEPGGEERLSQAKVDKDAAIAALQYNQAYEKVTAIKNQESLKPEIPATRRGSFRRHIAKTISFIDQAPHPEPCTPSKVMRLQRLPQYYLWLVSSPFQGRHQELQNTSRFVLQTKSCERLRHLSGAGWLQYFANLLGGRALTFQASLRLMPLRA